MFVESICDKYYITNAFFWTMNKCQILFYTKISTRNYYCFKYAVKTESKKLNITGKLLQYFPPWSFCQHNFQKFCLTRCNISEAYIWIFTSWFFLLPYQKLTLKEVIHECQFYHCWCNNVLKEDWKKDSRNVCLNYINNEKCIQSNLLLRKY